MLSSALAKATQSRDVSVTISFSARISLARLAVDLNHQRQGQGELLLADALQRCLHISESIGMLGVIVDAKDERARGWYERYEFERLPDSPLTLWLPTAAIPRT